MADHDHSYKLLFSHAELVADLLGGFVHEPWVEQLDVTTPEQTDLRRAFTVWLGRVLLPRRLSGVELPMINELREVETMLAERAKEWTKQWWEGGVEQGMQQGMQQGVQQGEVAVLLRQIKRKYGSTVAATFQQRVEQADAETLLVWSERILTAESIDDIFG